MLKPVVTLAAVAAVGVLFWKLLGLLLLPLLGVALGVVVTIIKLAFVALMVFFVLWLFRRSGRREAGAG